MEKDQKQLFEKLLKQAEKRKEYNTEYNNKRRVDMAQFNAWIHNDEMVRIEKLLKDKNWTKAEFLKVVVDRLEQSSQKPVMQVGSQAIIKPPIAQAQTTSTPSITLQQIEKPSAQVQSQPKQKPSAGTERQAGGIWLNVPANEYKEAEALGAKYDFVEKCQYKPADLEVGPFEKWFKN